MDMSSTSEQRRGTYQIENDENDRQENEYQFARSFWRPADPPQALHWNAKFGFTLLICMFMVIIGIQLIPIMLNHQLWVFLSILVITLIIVNLNLSRASFLFWLKWRKYNQVKRVKECNALEFSFLNGVDDVLYIKTDRSLTVMGLYKVWAISIEFKGDFEDVVRSLYRQQIPFYMVLTQGPIKTEEILEENNPIVSEDARIEYTNIFERSPQEMRSRLDNRGGIWAASMVIGTHHSISREKDNEYARLMLYEAIKEDLSKIKVAFKPKYPYTRLKLLRGKDLVSTFKLLAAGDAKASFYFSGYELADHLLGVPQILSKSLGYHHPAEFIVPTKIYYDVGPIGRAYETENLRDEVPAGLLAHDMRKGVLVAGGTVEQRFRTNTKLVHETVKNGGNYLIITANPEWRRLLDLIPNAQVFALGNDLTYNPLDAENNDYGEYAAILTQAFSQTFQLSTWAYEEIKELIFESFADKENPELFDLKEKIESIILEPRTDVYKELRTVQKFLANANRDKMGLIFGQRTIPFNVLTKGCNIIELNVGIQDQLQFIFLCILAKTLAYAHNHPDQKFMVLVDFGDFLISSEPHNYKTQQQRSYFLEWVQRFRQNNVGLHLSLQALSHFPPEALHNIQTVLAHKITPYNDVQIMRDLLQLLPERIVHSRKARHANHQIEYLKNLPTNQIILKRPDITRPFTVIIMGLDFRNTHVWTPEEIRARVKRILPGFIMPEPDQRPLLERDFPRNTKIVRDLLSLLQEYPALGTTALLSSLNSDPQNDLDKPELELVLGRLQMNGYVRMAESEYRGRQRYTYEITDKGRELYMNYLRLLKRRLRELSGEQKIIEEVERVLQKIT